MNDLRYLEVEIGSIAVFHGREWTATRVEGFQFVVCELIDASGEEITVSVDNWLANVEVSQ